MNTANTPGFLTIHIKKTVLDDDGINPAVPGVGPFAYVVGSIDQDINIPHIIPEQLMRLRSYRVHMKSLDDSLRVGVLYVDLPFLSSVQIMDNSDASTLLPLELDNNVVTIQNGCNKPVLLTRPIQERFHIRALSKSPASNILGLEDQIHSITLQFELERSALR